MKKKQQKEEMTKDQRIQELEEEVKRLKEIIIFQSSRMANLTPEQIKLTLRRKQENSSNE